MASVIFFPRVLSILYISNVAVCVSFYLFTDDCDFESVTICGYTQDKTDNFDWTRDYGGTTSSGTGPAVDHTYKTKTGTQSF